ncbi:hypothetical protein RMCBS344292_01933 [Rhizopus microsporus]|nr:hypothetical protein RMCBS344292_01933 [Rhizopus microsporus]
MEERSQSRRNRWFSASMAQEGSLPTPILETNTTDMENQSGSSTRFCDGDPKMANTILVTDGAEAQQGGASSFHLEEESLSNCMAVIRMYQEKEWMDKPTGKFLAQAIRKSTNDAYNRYWKKLGKLVFFRESQERPNGV